MIRMIGQTLINKDKLVSCNNNRIGILYTTHQRIVDFLIDKKQWQLERSKRNTHTKNIYVTRPPQPKSTNLLLLIGREVTKKWVSKKRIETIFGQQLSRKRADQKYRGMSPTCLFLETPSIHQGNGMYRFLSPSKTTLASNHSPA